MKIPPYLWLLPFTLAILAGCSAANNINAQATVLPAENRPNIIIILADDLDERLGTTQYMTNLKTLLTEEGTTLQDFLITTPMCCPSRVNLLRSEYTHSHEVYNNSAPYGGFPKFYETGREVSTLPVWLQAAGYHTALMGKYLNAYPLVEDRTYIPPGWSEWYSPGRKNAYDGYDYYLNENGELIPYGMEQENFFTDVMSRKSVEFIERMAADQQPFFLYLAPFAPHEPAAFANRHADLLKNIQAPRSPSFNETDITDKAEIYLTIPSFDAQTEANIDEYYRRRVLSMLAVDEMIAEVVQAVESNGLMENTYIIFTSDQGFTLGQHRIARGKSSFFDEDIVVPFVVRGPGIPAGESLPPFLASVVDLGPTIAEWAGVQPPNFVVGTSFAQPLTTGTPPTSWRQAMLLEQYAFSLGDEGDTAAPSFGILGWHTALLKTPFQQTAEALPKWAGMRTLDYAYFEHPDGFIELYDLKTDPHQMENVAPAAPEKLLSEFSNWLAAMQTCEGLQCRTLETSISK